MLLAAAGLAVLAGATPASSYDRVLAALLLAGSGIGVAMAPATDSVMGSLPRAKASIGSAMNDTARLVGGAFGVAVLGSTISLVYRTHIATAAAQLPARAAGPAQGSLQGALQVAQHLGGPPRRVLETAARLVFTDAMNRAALVGAAIALAAALVALVLLPARAARQNPAAPSHADLGLLDTRGPQSPAPGDGPAGVPGNRRGAWGDTWVPEQIPTDSGKAFTGGSGPQLAGPI